MSDFSVDEILEESNRMVTRFRRCKNPRKLTLDQKI